MNYLSVQERALGNGRAFIVEQDIIIDGHVIRELLRGQAGFPCEGDFDFQPLFWSRGCFLRAVEGRSGGQWHRRLDFGDLKLRVHLSHERERATQDQ